MWPSTSPPTSYARFMGRYSEPLADQFVELAGVRRGHACAGRRLRPGRADRAGSRLGWAPRTSPRSTRRRRSSRPRGSAARASTYARGGRRCCRSRTARSTSCWPSWSCTSCPTRSPGCGRWAGWAALVGATVWNHATATGPLSTFWQAAKDLDPAAADEATLPGTGEGDLGALAREAGLRDVVEGTLTVTVPYSSFEEWWEPYTLGVGPAGDHVARLDDDARAASAARAARSCCRTGRSTVAAHGVDGACVRTLRAWTSTPPTPTGSPGSRPARCRSAVADPATNARDRDRAGAGVLGGGRRGRDLPGARA